MRRTANLHRHAGLLPECAGVDCLKASPGCRAIPPAVLHRIERDAVVNLSFACNGFRQALRSGLAASREQAHGKANRKDHLAQLEGAPSYTFGPCFHIALPLFRAESNERLLDARLGKIDIPHAVP